MAEVAEAADVVAEVADEVSELPISLEPNAMRLLLIGGAVGLFGGAVIGVAVVNRRLRKKYEQISAEEIAEMRGFYQERLLANQGKKPDLAEEAQRIAKEEGYTAPDEPVAEVPDVEASEEPADAVAGEKTKNIFNENTAKDASEGWDYEVERSVRTAENPYIIHVDELNDGDYTRTSFTYYAEDGVLCDERDNVVENPETIVGTVIADEKFGHGSPDTNKVYVRNDALGVDIEISRTEDSYAKAVHGLEHSDEPMSRRRGRRRFDDESDRERA